VFFAVDSHHENYKLSRNVVQAQMYVSEFRLDDYPVRAQDVLHTGAGGLRCRFEHRERRQVQHRVRLGRHV
jgi:hypothetical protein